MRLARSASGGDPRLFGSTYCGQARAGDEIGRNGCGRTIARAQAADDRGTSVYSRGSYLMTWSGWLFVVVLIGVAYFYVRHVGVNLSLTSVFLGLLLVFHGPMYLYYTRVFGPDTDFFDQILAAAPGRPVIQTLDVALGLCLACVCAGVWVANRAYRVSDVNVRSAVADWGGRELAMSADEARRLRSMVIACSVAMLPFVLLDAQIGKIAQFLSSDLDTAEKMAFRREEGGSGYYVYNLALSTIFSFALFAGLAGSRIWRGSIGWIIKPTAILFGLILLAKIATLSKAPAVIFFLQCASVFVMARSLRLKGSVLLLLVVAAAAGFTLMTFAAVPNLEGLSFALEFVFYRTFMVVNEGLLEYFSAIPNVIDFSWGAHLSWVGSLLQITPEPPTYLLVGAVHRAEIGSTTTVMFLGDAWADFAWPGIVVSAIAAGFIVRALDIKLILQRGRSVAAVAGLAIGQYGVFTALNTSLQTALVTGGLAFILLFARLLDGARFSSSAAVKGA
jgi:hypothetical protein